MTDAEILAALDDRQTLALTGLFEAGSDGVAGMTAVMCVVRNRGRHALHVGGPGESYKALCLAPDQFSCWLPGSGANHDRLMRAAEAIGLQCMSALGPLTDQIQAALHLADGVMDGSIEDTTGGALNYYAPAAMEPPGRVPAWAADKPFLEIGTQRFLTA